MFSDAEHVVREYSSTISQNLSQLRDRCKVFVDDHLSGRSNFPETLHRNTSEFSAGMSTILFSPLLHKEDESSMHPVFGTRPFGGGGSGGRGAAGRGSDAISNLLPRSLDRQGLNDCIQIILGLLSLESFLIPPEGLWVELPPALTNLYHGRPAALRGGGHHNLNNMINGGGGIFLTRESIMTFTTLAVPTLYVYDREPRLRPKILFYVPLFYFLVWRLRLPLVLLEVISRAGGQVSHALRRALRFLFGGGGGPNNDSNSTSYSGPGRQGTSTSSRGGQNEQHQGATSWSRGLTDYLSTTPAISHWSGQGYRLGDGRSS